MLGTRCSRHDFSAVRCFIRMGLRCHIGMCGMRGTIGDEDVGLVVNQIGVNPLTFVVIINVIILVQSFVLSR